MPLEVHLEEDLINFLKNSFIVTDTEIEMALEKCIRDNFPILHNVKGDLSLCICQEEKCDCKDKKIFDSDRCLEIYFKFKDKDNNFWHRPMKLSPLLSVKDNINACLVVSSEDKILTYGGPPELIWSEEVIEVIIKKNLTSEEIDMVVKSIFLQIPLLEYADGTYEVGLCDCEECALLESDNKDLMVNLVK
jgi:hypothetical protein